MDNYLFVKEKKIISRFFSDNVVDIIPVGHGNTNYTHIITLQSSNGNHHRVILQKINHYIFPDIDGLMNNIYNVTEYLRSHLSAGEDPERSVMTVVKALDGKLYTKYGKEYYRCYIMVENSISYQKVECEQDFYYCGFAFGDFQRRLAKYPAENLCETIKDYHNTEIRYNNLLNAISANKAGRKITVEKEIEFFLNHKDIAHIINDRINSGTIPLRIVHNDAKLNNMLFDAHTNLPLCIIDLDNVMPGAACFDFGDAIRFAGTRYTDKNSGEATLDLRLFEAYTKGFLSVAKEFLTPEEIDTLAVSALVITYECGMRFLTDYLNGDIRFRTSYSTHNLDRCRNHIRLVEDIKMKLPLMQEIVLKHAK